MTDRRFLVPWRRRAWRREVEAWIDEQLTRRGRSRSGTILQPHVRPWSTVLTAPTREGQVYFKATAPTTANDAALTNLLSQREPRLVIAPIAVDVERRWMLLPAGGERLREVLAADRDLGHWERLLPRYAQLQMSLAGRVPELLAAGALDRRLDRLSYLLEALLHDSVVRRATNPHGLDDEELRRAVELQPAVARACEELGADPVGQSIQHDDLHDGNVVVDGEARIFDWGDAAVTHPFGTLLVTLRSVAFRAELSERSGRIRRLRDAYLEPWEALASRRALLRATSLATWLGYLVRALSWQAALVGATPAAHREWDDAVPDAIRGLVAATPKTATPKSPRRTERSVSPATTRTGRPRPASDPPRGRPR